jgi:carboxyl-terminal processing protease
MERIPDSLTHVFYTRGGREVRDGGGIKPDVEVRNDTVPNIAYYLSGAGMDSTEVMFDYVVDYISRHPQIPSPREFHLSDADYAEFTERVLKSGFKYDLMSKKQFDELVKTAKYEGYYEQSKDAFDALEARLRHDVSADLQKHSNTIRQMIELDIVAAYYYQRGAVEAGLSYDKQLHEAQRLLLNEQELAGILRPSTLNKRTDLVKKTSL